MKPVALARISLVFLLAMILTLVSSTVAHGVSPTSRTCDEAGLDAALAAGGVNVFSCTKSTTIMLTSSKAVSVSGTLLDGGGILTISGGDSYQVFTVGSGITATFANMTIRDGNAKNGAAISSMGSLTVRNVYFLDNSVTGAGGAIMSTGPSFTVEGSTFSGNSAAGTVPMGGAIYIAESTAPTITNSTFYNNSAERGGAILTSGASVALTVTASTFSDNIATTSYGASSIFASNGAVKLQYTVLKTSTDRNCNGTMIDGGNNLQYGGSSNSCGATIQTGDPKLGALGFYGGVTPTLPLLAGSPAIDKIAAGQCIVTTDQRGAYRPAFGGTSTSCDIGAYELQQMQYLPMIIH